MMIDTQLLEYIKQQISEWVPREDIIQNLLQNGWQQQDIDEAFFKIDNLVNVPEEVVSKNQVSEIGSEAEVCVEGQSLSTLDKRTSFILSLTSACIAILAFFGIQFFAPGKLWSLRLFTQVDLMLASALYIIGVALFVGICVLLAWWLGRRLYRKEQLVFDAFFWGLAVS